MAKTRIINTSFWCDSFIQELDIDSKLLFLYLLTNPHTDICGVYEISKKTMCFETNLDPDRLSKAIETLSEAKKITYKNNWVWIKNFSKHQIRCNRKCGYCRSWVHQHHSEKEVFAENSGRNQ